MKTKMVVGLACAVLIAAAAPARSDGLEYSITPYVWTTGLDGSLGATTATDSVAVALDASIGDEFELTIPVHFEAQGPVFTLIAEVSVGSVDQELVAVAGDADIDILMVELLSGWQFSPSTELIFGARFVDLEAELGVGGILTSADPDLEQDWVDPVVGLRYGGQLNRRGTWQFKARGDVAGFGLGSDVTINARLSFGLEFSEVTSFWFGYRWLDVDYDDNGFQYDILQHGPEIGLKIKF